MEWFSKYRTEIGFFISGWCAFAALNSLGQGEYGWAAFNAALSYINARFAR